MTLNLYIIEELALQKYFLPINKHIPINLEFKYLYMSLIGSFTDCITLLGLFLLIILNNSKFVLISSNIFLKYAII